MASAISCPSTTAAKTFFAVSSHLKIEDSSGSDSSANSSRTFSKFLPALAAAGS